MAQPSSLATSLPFAADFMLDVLQAASSAPYGAVTWPEINRLAARWLRPVPGVASNTSRLGHALVAEMAEHGLIDAELTTAPDGSLVVERVLHPLIFGLDFGRSLAA